MAKQKSIGPSLYGIGNSNRDFSDPYFWGKNQFNSAFPVALACFMRDAKISATYLRLNEKKLVCQDNIGMDDVFGTKLQNQSLYFAFESRFDPYKRFVHDELESIDLVVKDADSGTPIRPLEIKLTTLPDNTTESLSEDKYGCEIVIRSATMRYMALSMALSLESKLNEIKKIFEPVCIEVRQWENEDEMRNKMPNILKALEIFSGQYSRFQQPLLMQPIWKTKGKSPILADNCLDIFVWSDFALTRLFMDSALENESERISRQQRAALRLARFLFEVSRSGAVYQRPIYDGMSLGNQTDKEFAISGNKTYKYMKCDRLKTPIIHKKDIKKIILGGGHKHLSPERRFDAILYFAQDLF